MSRTLRSIIPPHKPDDEKKVEKLAAAYERKKKVKPVVVLDFDGQLRAISGSHRLAALRLAFPDRDTTLEDVGDYVLVVDGQKLYDRLGEDSDGRDEIDRLLAGRGVDFSDLISGVWPKLDGATRRALRDQRD